MNICFICRSISSTVDPIVANKISKDIEVLSSTVTKALAVIKSNMANGNNQILILFLILIFNYFLKFYLASLSLSDDFSSPLAAKRGNEKPLVPSTDNSFR